MRIAFADLDDTLLAPDKSIPGRNLEALDRISACGLEFVPCTGRPLVGVPQVLLDHPSVGHVVGGGGSVVYELGARSDGGARPVRTIHKQLLGASRTLALYERVKDLDITFDVFADDHVLSERSRYDRLGLFDLDPAFLAALRAMRTPVDLTVPQILEQAHDVQRVTIYWRDPADRALVEQVVDADPSLVRVSSCAVNIEVTDAAATKGSALVWLCGYLGISVGESVAFGDSSNDVSMLEAAGDGVAMGNATCEAMAASDHVCGVCGEAGVGRYLEALLG
jgi:Cof subfamily protein (haloacid dehalogenase superfamily)